ncbi:putative serine/threonine protein kinase KIC1 NDAI_0C01700 [Naumovozyma dairenensis CBS 421]|uniref:non-specific serine/threonine protein kinase n=1 Tax=Naumovozyma dairenensis (strain ATCC 10597 / BCRC 20456 / CBS 421 / NBRC 0211 / NRRL Y-12639) TaxID=1071378 RepID=G0W7S0_NAUDC|nr:hypothetical protein NDAI_0C01700 [Naumovozyma dairenensis CBS 421]CCD23831.1 hypothetical protein NDAI_0C01700 [Naumovozyma dairenensis CBS 421]
MRKASFTSSSGTPIQNGVSKQQQQTLPSHARLPADKDINSVFRRTEVIGRGKFGIVYKGYHVKTKQIYAIKVLNLDSDEDEVEDVQREIQFLASLKQLPNITRYYGSYLKDTSLWIIMEYCAGGSLRTLLRPGKIDEKYIGVITREILIALKYIHKDNIIHRDIKAANVLITNEGSIKLCDFGVAAQLNQSTKRRQTMAGTPYWMAPEVIMEGVYYDTKVDIWSLGITTYEIATGNPPYCEIEALRAMQLITKSKPPRLEGRNYSPLLKEFVALCLDEDPKERMSAEDLLKTKFIKAHKLTPVSILKELISRYLLFRDRNKTLKEEGALPEEEKADNKKSRKETSDNTDNTVTENKSIDKNIDEEENVDVKWDFDSLSSSEYIIENNINIDAIPEEATVDWSADGQQEHFNYAYPDEEQYYYHPTNKNGKSFYQSTTIGKHQPGTVHHNSTLNAPLTQLNTTENIRTRPMGGTHTTNNNMTHNTEFATGKKVETKTPKQLLELFEENEPISDDNAVETDINRINSNLSAMKLNGISAAPIEGRQLSSGMDAANTSRPHQNFTNGNAFYSQSTSALPILQTKFTGNNKGPTSAITTAPTSIEIEIPEELPSSIATSLTPLENEPNNLLPTKPRASTVSITAQGSQHQKQPVLSRRVTLSESTNRADSVPKPADANLRSDGRGQGTVGAVTTTSTSASILPAPNNNFSTSNNKLSHRTPSPTRMLVNKMTTPGKKTTGSPTGPSSSKPHASNLTNLGPPPIMKPIIANDDNKDLLLQPLNSKTNNNMYSLPIKEKETTSRVNGDFKRNNPNLKLQMPLPTSVLRNKLLDSSQAPASASATVTSNLTSQIHDNINQFGFNTSSASNVPVSMTPISEKNLDLGARLRRSQSTSTRKPSNSNEHSTVLGSTSVLLNNASTGQSNLLSAASSSSLNTSLTSNSGNVNNTVTSTNTVMQCPPNSLNMQIFQDTEFSSSGISRRIDRKPQMLDELRTLLQMFDESLPLIEHALEKQLPATHTTENGDH